MSGGAGGDPVSRPPRPDPATLIREARKCEATARRWDLIGLVIPVGPGLVHAVGQAGHWREQATRWEAAARAACSPVRWAWWRWRHTVPTSPSGRNRHGVAVAWPERAPEVQLPDAGS